MTHTNFFDAIFRIFRVKLGGLDMKTGKTSKFIKIDLYMGSPTHKLWAFWGYPCINPTKIRSQF